jgi:hypothetical protein
MIVRKMRPDDIDSVVNLYERYFTEASEVIPGMAEEWDENSVINTVRSYSAHWDHCWYVAEQGQRLIGFIAGYASETPWNKDIINANIAFVFLTQDQRNMDNFRLLMHQFEEWAYTIDAHKITGGDIGINVERTRSLYEYYDFKPVLFMAKDLK